LWKKYIDVNVMGVYYCTRAVIGGMIENGYGRVINVASVAGVYGNVKMVHYSTTKGALIAMTKALAKELGPSGIRVNCVAPGVILTDMCANVEPEIMDEMKNETPVGRNGTPTDIAKAMAYLADAEFITGHVLSVNGGYVI
jgi:3-oxoacyl-[acyl-carrier protein] reductase